MRTVTVQLSEEAFTAVCGIVQPNSEVDSEGIFTGAWDELRDKFPIEFFQKAVEEGRIEYLPDAGV